MAQDSDVPKAADKGKGKATEEPKNDKQLPILNGKKDDDKKDGTLYLRDVHSALKQANFSCSRRGGAQ
jgi:26S proteasome regulatory subunit N1